MSKPAVNPPYTSTVLEHQASGRDPNVKYSVGVHLAVPRDDGRFLDVHSAPLLDLYVDHTKALAFCTKNNGQENQRQKREVWGLPELWPAVSPHRRPFGEAWAPKR